MAGRKLPVFLFFLGILTLTFTHITSLTASFHELTRGQSLPDASQNARNKETIWRTQSTSTSDHEQNKNFVVLSTTLHEFVRPEDYEFLTPLVARNWNILGNFTPIIIVVVASTSKPSMNSSSSAEQDMEIIYEEYWKSILPSGTIVVPVVVDKPELSIFVSQMSRLFVVSMLPQQLVPNDAYIRVTDADMMIAQARPFLPPKHNNQKLIHIYNGDCCLGNHIVPKSPTNEDADVPAVPTTCNQYPMHSIGMQASAWRDIFSRHNKLDALSETSRQTKSSNARSDLARQVLSVAHSFFGLNETHGNISGAAHGGQNWYRDQIFLGCTIGQANRTGKYQLQLARMGERAHVSLPPRINSDVSDIHLSSFKLLSHEYWLQDLITHTGVLGVGYRQQYRSYVDRWKTTPLYHVKRAAALVAQGAANTDESLTPQGVVRLRAITYKKSIRKREVSPVPAHDTANAKLQRKMLLKVQNLK